MKHRFLLLVLLLSTVVIKTDSCSSFVGWKLRHVDVEQNNIEKELTTQKIDVLDNKMIANNNRIYRPASNPIIVPIGATIERCEESFEEIYCSGRGVCLIIDYNTGNITEPQCICNQGYTGNQCMEKLPDNEYMTIKIRQDATQEYPIKSSTTSSTIIETSTIRESLELGEKAPCPSPWKEDYCLNGECYMIPHLSTIDYFCICHNNYSGTQCNQKVADYHYDTYNVRKRRQISVEKRRKNRINPRFRRHIT